MGWNRHSNVNVAHLERLQDRLLESDNAVPSFVGLKNWRYTSPILWRDLLGKNVRSYEDSGNIFLFFLNFNFLFLLHRGNEELIGSENINGMIIMKILI